MLNIKLNLANYGAKKTVLQLCSRERSAPPASSLELTASGCRIS